jgi:hypothetical protein
MFPSWVAPFVRPWSCGQTLSGRDEQRKARSRPILSDQVTKLFFIEEGGCPPWKLAVVQPSGQAADRAKVE